MDLCPSPPCYTQPIGVWPTLKPATGRHNLMTEDDCDLETPPMVPKDNSTGDFVLKYSLRSRFDQKGAETRRVI